LLLLLLLLWLLILNQWYVLYGGMQDWNYLHAGCFELTVELSDNKVPPKSQLDEFWEVRSRLAGCLVMITYCTIRHKDHRE
jgi:hypothetical protein